MSMCACLHSCDNLFHCTLSFSLSQKIQHISAETKKERTLFLVDDVPVTATSAEGFGEFGVVNIVVVESIIGHYTTNMIPNSTDGIIVWKFHVSHLSS